MYEANTRSRVLKGAIGVFTTAMGWGWVRRRLGMLAAIGLSVVQSIYYLGVVDWVR